ncbi:hypothetical protein GCM10009856_52360 [Mycolicibacterium llatzerense]
MLTGPAPPLIEATRPTSTPRILTFAPRSITNPERSDTNVTVSKDLKDPAKKPKHTTTDVTMAATRISVHHAG